MKKDPPPPKKKVVEITQLLLSKIIYKIGPPSSDVLILSIKMASVTQFNREKYLMRYHIKFAKNPDGSEDITLTRFLEVPKIYLRKKFLST